MFTKSFKKGFGDGFISPFNFFMPHPIEEPTPATIDRAWEDVAKLIRKSALEEIEKIGKEKLRKLYKEK